MFPEDISEEERKAVIEAELIKMADGDEQKLWRLRKLQAKIDRERKKYVHPLAAMNAIGGLMWDKFNELRELLNDAAKKTGAGERR
jgi:hypothetical protein